MGVVMIFYLYSCVELVTTGVSRFFSVNSAEERDEWIETIKQSSVSDHSLFSISW